MANPRPKHRHLFDDPDEDGLRVCQICGYAYRVRPVLGPADPELAREQTCKWYYQPVDITGTRMGFPEPVESYQGRGFKAWAPTPAAQLAGWKPPETYHEELKAYEAARAVSYESALNAHYAHLDDTLVLVPEKEEPAMPYNKTEPKYKQIIEWLHNDRVLYAEPFSLQQFCEKHRIEQKPASQTFFILTRSGLLATSKGKGRGRSLIYHLAQKNGQWNVTRAVKDYLNASSAYNRERKQIQRERKQEEQRREEARLAKQRAAAEAPLEQRIAELEERNRHLTSQVEKQTNGERGRRWLTPGHLEEYHNPPPGTPERVQCQVPDEFGGTFTAVLERHQAIMLRDWLLTQYPLDPPKPKEPEVPTFHIGG